MTPVLDNNAEVRIVHAVDSVVVDVFANGAELLGDFDYTDTTNGYVKVEAVSWMLPLLPPIRASVTH